jgi:hypothetical protein
MQDHMIRDINAARFPRKTNLVVVSHGLALRIFLMRWFHWTLVSVCAKTTKPLPPLQPGPRSAVRLLGS